ncbi:hypothetical protein VTK26DRAFT_8429 [Humicola hyalothermophila]
MECWAASWVSLCSLPREVDIQIIGTYLPDKKEEPTHFCWGSISGLLVDGGFFHPGRTSSLQPYHPYPQDTYLSPPAPSEYLASEALAQSSQYHLYSA